MERKCQKVFNKWNFK